MNGQHVSEIELSDAVFGITPNEKAVHIAVAVSYTHLDVYKRQLYGIVMVIVYTVVLDKVLLFGTTRTEVKIISQHEYKAVKCHQQRRQRHAQQHAQERDGEEMCIRDSGWPGSSPQQCGLPFRSG